MRISHQYKFIFFANPKTGSSSVRQFLNPYTDQQPVLNYLKRTPQNLFYPHMSPEETRLVFQNLNWDFYGYQRFVFVRNPWARLVSLYEHIMRNVQHPPAFTEWLYTIKPKGVGGGGEDHQRWRKYGSYSIEYYIKDQTGNILVDKVLRLEDIQHTLRPYLSGLGLPNINKNNLNHSNKRKNKEHYSQYYDSKAIEWVGEQYKYDIINFGYTFEREKRNKIFHFLNRKS